MPSDIDTEYLVPHHEVRGVPNHRLLQGRERRLEGVVLPAARPGSCGEGGRRHGLGRIWFDDRLHAAQPAFEKEQGIGHARLRFSI